MCHPPCRCAVHRHICLSAGLPVRQFQCVSVSPSGGALRIQEHDPPLGGDLACRGRSGAARGERVYTLVRADPARPRAPMRPSFARCSDAGREARLRKSSGIMTSLSGDSCRCEERAGIWGSICGLHFIPFRVRWCAVLNAMLLVRHPTRMVRFDSMCVWLFFVQNGCSVLSTCGYS